MPVTLDTIQQAAKTIKGHVRRTPMLFSDGLSQRTGANIWVKHENLQLTNSFKTRGAFVKMNTLSEKERSVGVVTMSAGNHAQAVAYHAQKFGIPATIVMPENTPFVKIRRTESFGAHVILKGQTMADSQITAEELVADKGLTLVHAYDDDLIIAGQGTIAIEMLEDNPDLDVIVVPIGGGGIISGVATAAKALKPGIAIIGAEAELFPSMTGALKGEEVSCGGQTIAEGIAVKNVTPRTIDITRKLVSDIHLVSEQFLENAVAAYLDDHKTVAEGAGAAGLAAVLNAPESFAGKNVGLVLCGGNIDPRILASVIFRNLGREKRIVSLRVEIHDQPGTLAFIAKIIGDTRGNILEVSHKRLFLDVPAKGATLDLMLETRGPEHVEEIVGKLSQAGFSVSRLDDRLQSPKGA